MRAAAVTVGFTILVALACRPKPAPHAKANAETVAEVDALLHVPRAVRWAPAASLLGDGEASCIDGRSTSPVVGTPGGDLGAIVVALGAAERVTGAPLDLARMDALLDAYVKSFGRVYFHTDAHALERIGAALRRDARFAGAPLREAADIHAFVLAPPPELRDAVLAYLSAPENVGCGHLRLMLGHAERYEVRAGLVRAIVEAAFRLAWRSPAAVDYVVLRGDHHERAIVEVHTERPVHGSSLVPLVTPHEGEAQVFVRHPEVEAFLRAENAEFFVDHASLVTRSPLDASQLSREMGRLSEHHLHETVERLARGLPVVRVDQRGDALVARRAE